MKYLFALVLSLFAVAVNAQTAQTCVPFQLLHHQIIVKVTIADQGSYPFLLDTGAQTTVVGPSIAQSLHLQTGGVVDVSGFGAKIQTPWSRTSIEVAGQRKANVGVLIYDAAQIQKHGDANIYGVLGANFLEGFTITLDYKNSCISLQ